MKHLPLAALSIALIFPPQGFAQTCNDAVAVDAPTSRYVLKADGTALDKKTGLIWMRCALGQIWDKGNCQGEPGAYTWQQALQTAEATVFAKQSGWRLPNQKELQSLVKGYCVEPAINLAAFPNESSGRYWSSSTMASDSSYAWVIDFYYGFDYLHHKDDNYFYVRLVRSGQ